MLSRGGKDTCHIRVYTTPPLPNPNTGLINLWLISVPMHTLKLIFTENLKGGTLGRENGDVGSHTNIRYYSTS